MRARRTLVRLGLAAVVSVGTAGCTEEDAEELSEALAPLLWALLVVTLLFTVVLAVGLWLLVSGLSRARQAEAMSEEARAGRRRAVVGGGLVAVVTGLYMGRPALLALALVAGVGLGAHTWRTQFRGRPWPEVAARAPKPLAVAVAGLLFVGVLGLAAGQPSVEVKTTEQTPVLPSPLDPDVQAEADCRRRVARAHCDEATALSERLVLSPPMAGEWAGPLVVSLEPDGSAVVVSSVTSDFGGLEMTADNYIEAFEKEGWAWTNRPPCPPGRSPTFCERPLFLFSGAPAAALHFERRSPPGARAELDLTSQGSQRVAVQARVAVARSAA